MTKMVHGSHVRVRVLGCVWIEGLGGEGRGGFTFNF